MPVVEYGMPYMGSKGGIAKEVIKIFPKADHFYDLFGGGFSITHAMLRHRLKHYKHFHFNEIRPRICELIQDAIAGKYSYENFKPPFVDRDTFFKNKDKCAYTKVCWSFGKNGKDYLFSKDIEPYKKSMHNAIVFNEFDDLAKAVLKMDAFKQGYSVKNRRLFLRQTIETYRKTAIPKVLHKFLNKKQLQRLEQLQRLQQIDQLRRLEQIERLEQLQQLRQLEQLERLKQLQRLQQIERLKRLNFYNGSYDKVDIKPNSIIYCDPPYKNTGSYDGDFDHKRFLDWAADHKTPVFISEYDIPDNRFFSVKKIQKRSMLSPYKDNTLIKTEKIYMNKAALKLVS